MKDKVDTLVPEEECAPRGPAGPGLLDLFGLLVERKAQIALAALFGGMVCAAIAFALPPRFTATTVILPPQQVQSAASALLGQLGPLAGTASRELGLKSPGDLYIGILNSRTIADAIITRFGLLKIYGKSTMMDGRKRLAERTSIQAGRDSLIRISVEDEDPGRAADLANAFVGELHRQNRRLALTEAGQRRLFFTQQLEAEKEALAAAEVSLRETQERTGVLQVSGQVDALIKSIAQLRASIATGEVSLRALRTGATSSNPEVIRQETELNELRAQLRQMETSQVGRRAGDVFVPASRVPEAGLEHVRAMRELKYHETLFEMLAKQLEVAKIDEAKQSPLIQVVDSALPPDRKSWPPRAGLSLAGAILAATMACLYILARHRFPLESAEDSDFRKT